jgi:primosomal replication protein N
VVEAGIGRTLEFTAEAIALGDAARELSRLTLGSGLQIEGFIAPRSRRSTRIRVHVTAWRPQTAAAAGEDGQN